MLIALVLALVVMSGFFALLETVTRSSANDQERSVSLVEQTNALHRIMQELDGAYKVIKPLTEGEYNYIDVDAWVTKPGSKQEARQIVINCEEPSPIAGEEQCVRYELPVTEEKALSELKADPNAKSRVDLYRLVNPTKKAFSLKDPSETGSGRPTYGTMRVETPAAGERITVQNQHDYTYEVTLKDSFYMRNLDFDR